MSPSELYLEQTYSNSAREYNYKNRFNRIDDQEFEWNAKMYCKLKRLYKKSEDKRNTKKDKAIVSKTTRIFK